MACCPCTGKARAPLQGVTGDVTGDLISGARGRGDGAAAAAARAGGSTRRPARVWPCCRNRGTDRPAAVRGGPGRADRGLPGRGGTGRPGGQGSGRLWPAGRNEGGMAGPGHCMGERRLAGWHTIIQASGSQVRTCTAPTRTGSPGHGPADRRSLSGNRVRGGAVPSGAAPSRRQTPSDAGPVTARNRGCLPPRKTASPHRDIPAIRIIALTWSPVTESNRRPSPYHVPLNGSRGPGSALDQVIRWHKLAETSLNQRRQAPFCPSNCPSGSALLRPNPPPPVECHPVRAHLSNPALKCTNSGQRPRPGDHQTRRSSSAARGSGPSSSARRWPHSVIS
jgi:hypothetical protein